MSIIILAIIALVVVVIVGFVAFLAIYQIQQRRQAGPGHGGGGGGGGGTGSLFPTSFRGVFGGSSERETGTRFAALEYANKLHICPLEERLIGFAAWTKPGIRMWTRRWAMIQ